MRIVHALTAAALGLVSAGVLAQAAPATPATPGIDQRQARQEQRIDQGIASGELNKRETRRLGREQGAIDRAENKAKADGNVTTAERHHLRHMQSRASKDIHRQKHDAQTRAVRTMPPGGPGTGPSASPGG